MTPEFKAKWVAALRSGKYQKGRYVLRKGDKFCCLGVACDLIDPDAWERDNGYSPDEWERDNGYGTRDEMAWQGLNTETWDLPFIGISDAKTLSAMNDRADCLSFEEIADYIEAHVT